MRKFLLLVTMALVLISSFVLAQDTTLETFVFEDLPVLGTTEAGQEILLGGFSGLYFEGVDEETGELLFITHPDRGPNGEPIDTNGDGIDERPFPLPDYQAQWVRFAVNREEGTVRITEIIPLFRADGETPISGRPNLEGTQGLAYADEVPVDLFGNPLEYDTYGADMEGIVRADDGTYWMVDEYRPAIYHFTPDGILANRYVPEGSSANVDAGIEAFPAVYAQRRSNRGFEAVAYDGGKLYAFIQSPIDNPDVEDDLSSREGRYTRILEFDTTTMTATAEYLYMIEGGASDKIGDAVALGNGEFLVIERDSSFEADALKKVFRINLEGATNLMEVAEDVVIEALPVEELEANGITLVSKEIYVDLAAVGYVTSQIGDKPEGLALIDENTIAVINDNDFRLQGAFDPATGMLADNPDAFTPVLGIITIGE